MSANELLTPGYWKKRDTLIFNAFGTKLAQYEEQFDAAAEHPVKENLTKPTTTLIELKKRVPSLIVEHKKNVSTKKNLGKLLKAVKSDHGILHKLFKEHMKDAAANLLYGPRAARLTDKEAAVGALFKSFKRHEAFAVSVAKEIMKQARPRAQKNEMKDDLVKELDTLLGQIRSAKKAYPKIDARKEVRDLKKMHGGLPDDLGKKLLKIGKQSGVLDARLLQLEKGCIKIKTKFQAWFDKAFS